MEKQNQANSETTTHSHNSHTEHTHHHHHYSDGSSQISHGLLSSKKSKHIFGNVLFFVLSLVAIAIMAYVYWIYTNE